MSGKKNHELDFKKFPPGTVTEFTTVVCLACIFDIFTKQFGMAPRRAYSEIKSYAPTIAELTSRKAARPFFDADELNAHCPYCDATKRWHSRLDTFCLEGVKPADAIRRAFIKSLPKTNDQFKVLQIKSDRRSTFFDWLDTLRVKLDMQDEAWLIEAARAWLARRDPKSDWSEILDGVLAIRKSSRLADGWEKSGTRLYVAADLYNEILLVQYLLSRSHEHGGRTFDGRLTLIELLRRLRFSGYLKNHGIADGDQFEVLERIINQLSGSGSVTLYYIVDRREFLEKTKSVYARYAT